MLSFFSIFGSRLSSAQASSARRSARKPSAPRFFRPSLEGFEERVVPAAAVFEMAHAAPAAPAPAAAASNIVINSVNLTSFQIVDGVLNAAGTVSGTLAGLPFTADITNFALQLLPDDPATPGTECSVLHLQLAPIHLQLLGLHVDTSPICLDITATEGAGLLGDLLCGLAGGDGGLGLPVLPTATQIDTLEGSLGQILTSSLNQAKPGGADSVCTGECEVLNLSLGPVDLSLLGLNVHLDDCNDGPVQVCVSATASEGLLGGLLCGLADGGLPLDLGTITRLTDAVDNIDVDKLNAITEKQTEKLVNQVTNLLKDGDLSLKDISQLTKTLDRLTR